VFESVEFGNSSETANITIDELYEDFSSVAGGNPVRHDLLDHKPNFDWFQGGPVSSSALNEYQSHPIRFDEFYGATYDEYGGEGCLGVGTPITMADGTTKNDEDVNVGDWVRAATVPGMPLDFDDEDTWSEWTGIPHGQEEQGRIMYDIQISNISTPASASVQEVYFDYYDNYYLINGTLKATYEHPFFILRDGFQGEYSCTDDGRINGADITTAGKNYSSGSWNIAGGVEWGAPAIFQEPLE
jgi:hypothetical protein